MCYDIDNSLVMMQFCKVRNTHTHTENIDTESVGDAGTDFCANHCMRHSVYLTHSPS